MNNTELKIIHYLQNVYKYNKLLTSTANVRLFGRINLLSYFYT